MPSIFVDLSLNFVASQIHQGGGGGGGCPPPPKYGPGKVCNKQFITLGHCEIWRHFTRTFSSRILFDRKLSEGYFF